MGQRFSKSKRAGHSIDHPVPGMPLSDLFFCCESIEPVLNQRYQLLFGHGRMLCEGEEDEFDHVQFAGGCIFANEEHLTERAQTAGQDLCQRAFGDDDLSHRENALRK